MTFSTSLWQHLVADGFQLPLATITNSCYRNSVE